MHKGKVGLLRVVLIVGALVAVEILDLRSELSLRTQPSLLALAQAEPAAALSDVLNTRLQPVAAPPDRGGGGYAGPSDALSPAQHRAIWRRLHEQVRRLRAQGRLGPASSEQVALGWPLRPAHGLADYGYHGISNFVDHDLDFPNQLLDYHGGDRTYDIDSGYNHAGTDIFLWPYAWNKMDDNQVEVVAAAPGIIIDKTDGNYDRSCTMGANGIWNAVYVRHGDGSIAWYGHLKNGSLTPKPVGAAVTAGEYLGVVGSSGSSTAPHLHFELYDEAGALIDPFSDDAPISWWASQPPYHDSAVNKVATLDAEPAEAPCPQPETTRLQDSFMPGARAYFVTYFRDVLDTQESSYTIYQPDGTVFDTWAQDFAAIGQPHFASYYWYWWRDLPADAPAGAWRFEVAYQGHTYRADFNVGAPTAVAVTSPAGGEQWDLGLEQTIRWDDNIGGDVTIQLYHNGSYHATIVNATASSGTYLWLPAANLPLGGGYTIRVINTANPDVYDESDSFALVRTTLTDWLYLPQVQQ